MSESCQRPYLRALAARRIRRSQPENTMSWSVLFACCSATATAPHAPETAGFITTLGRDTVAIERFTLSGNGLRGEVVEVSPAVRRSTYIVTLRADGTPAD